MIGLFTILLNLFAQGQKYSAYDKFKSYFEQAQVDVKSKQKKLPIDLCHKILGDEIVNENVVDIYTFEYIMKKNNETFIIEVGRPQGGYTSTYYILSFLDKTLSKSEFIGYNALNLEGGTRCELTMVNDTTLEVKKEKVEYSEDCEKKNVFDTEYNYYLINDVGYNKIEPIEITSGRLYPQASSRILSLTELSNFKKSDLDIMRNEIFADYGYIFKSDKWKKHFESQSWYKPRFNDVTDKLTIIEKVNIDNILKIAPLK